MLEGKDIKLKRRNKSQKTWIRCSLAYFVWSLVGFVLLFHLYTSICRLEILNRELIVKMSQHPLLSEAEVIEDESIQMPPPRRRSPRAVMRKPKPPTTLIDEFLDEYSQIRHVFFLKIETAIDTMMCAESDKFYYYPGRTWLDTERNPIQAHGGGIVYDERSSKYYWYGEYKDGPTYQAHKNGYSRVVEAGNGWIYVGYLEGEMILKRTPGAVGIPHSQG
ncbi:glycosyl hydrolase family protein 43 [Striga asiatica]|uniref:Glycosyl hydrolase family protein 43 n=1 Tax=Striga asiatica TaxID=4170 RepID=A0A5A7QB28_STRAF|nr:glycosyl hydrolase family protein 43 [Striga asiatica]